MDRFELVPLRGGILGIRSLEFGEVCHPGVGPAREASTVYVEGLRLADRWRTHGTSPFVVWDVGLGGAANAMAVIGAALSSDVRLHLISFDRSLAALEFAVRHAESLGYFGELLEPARQLLTASAIHVRVHEHDTRIRWERVLGDFPTLMHSEGTDRWPAPHAILFDPHSPSANPEMWTLPLFRAMARRLDPRKPCALATYSRSTAVRAALLLAGFFVGVGPGTASREESTIAANTRELLSSPLGPRWLDRARRSHSAEPWTEAPFRPQPLTSATWELLRRHPQFTEATPGNDQAVRRTLTPRARPRR